MKKLISLLCALVLLVSTGALSAVLAEAPVTEEPEAVVEMTEDGVEVTEGKYDELVVATTTRFNGNFFSGSFGNNSSDNDVQQLIHGYNLIRWNTEEGMFAFDESVVGGAVVTDDREGNRTYTMALVNDMLWSDGTAVTAWDYAFSLLLSVSPVLGEIGGDVLHAGYIKGYQDYVEGTVPYLSGVKVISDDMLAITISKEYRPFFYEMGLLAITPMPIKVIAPGTRVADDGNGVYLTDKEMTAETLKATMLGETGYISAPDVVSGAYKILSYDGTTVALEANEMYKGNYLGNKPQIPHLFYTVVSNEEMLGKLASGEIGLANKIVRLDTINEGIAQIGTSEGAVSMSNYARTGLSFFAFCCEKPTVAEKEVRQAMDLCLDSASLISAYVGDYGLESLGYYGLGQWMFQVANGTLLPEVETEAEQEELLKEMEDVTMENIPAYAFDVEAAKQKLEKSGWKPGEDGIREKVIDGETVRLDLKMYYTEGNTIADHLDEYFLAPLKEAGINLTIEGKPFEQLLRIYYGMDERDCDLLYLATNFATVFDPSETFNPNAGMLLNQTAVKDEELYQLAVDMRATEPGEVIEYVKKWVAFQEKYMDVLPMIPLYSNVYFDFYETVLREYNVSEYVTWGEAIINAYLSDYVEEEEEETEAEEDGLVTF